LINDPHHHRRSLRLKGYDYSQAGAYFVTICTHDRIHLFGEVMDGEMRVNQWGSIVREEWFRTAQLRLYVVLYDDEFVVMPNHIHGVIWIVDDVGDDVGANDIRAQRRCAPTNPTIPTTHAGNDVQGNNAVWHDARGNDVGYDVGAQRCCARMNPTIPTIPTNYTGNNARGNVVQGNNVGGHDARGNDVGYDVGAQRCCARMNPTIPTTVVPGSTGAIIRAFKSAVTKRINELRNNPGVPVWQRNYHDHVIRDNGSLNQIRQYIIDNPIRWDYDRYNPVGTAPEQDKEWQDKVQ